MGTLSNFHVPSLDYQKNLVDLWRDNMKVCCERLETDYLLVTRQQIQPQYASVQWQVVTDAKLVMFSTSRFADAPKITIVYMG